MLADVVELLECPVCRAALAEKPGAVACVNGHSFDVAKQGYVNLLPASANVGTADTAEMIAARAAFLAAGHYDSVARMISARASKALSDLAVAPSDAVVADIGAGTGYYLARVLDALPGARGIALDISKHALRRAAKAHSAIGAVAADAWGRVPIADAAADVVLSVFAPRNPQEFARVLKPGGALVVAIPRPEHLAQLAEPLGLLGIQEDKFDRLAEKLEPLFESRAADRVERRMLLTPAECVTVAAMGPTGHHLSTDELEARAMSLPERVDVTLSVTVASFRVSG